MDPFPLWTGYGDTLRQLQAQLRELRRRELDSYRDLVIIPTPHQQPLANPILTIGTPPSPTGMPIPPNTQTPPLPLHNTTNTLAPFGGVPGMPTLAPAAAPIAVPAVGGAAVPHSTATPLLPTGSAGTNENTNPLFTVAELHARADVFRRTYRGSGQPHCRVNQSLCISRLQGDSALGYIRRARALINQLNIDEVGLALDLVLQETEEDIALGEFKFCFFLAGSCTDLSTFFARCRAGLRACEWQETLQRLCTFPPWDQQVSLSTFALLPSRDMPNLCVCASPGLIRPRVKSTPVSSRLSATQMPYRFRYCR